jgi:hypothetical protein
LEKESTYDRSDFEQLTNRISELEKRLGQLEQQVLPPKYRSRFVVHVKEEEGETQEPAITSREEGFFESRFGEYGMAWMGNIVLLAGILFMTQFLHGNDRIILSHVIGFIAVAGIYTAAYFTAKSLPYLSRLFYLR